MKLHQVVCHYRLVEAAWCTINKGFESPQMNLTVLIFSLLRVSLVNLDGQSFTVPVPQALLPFPHGNPHAEIFHRIGSRNASQVGIQDFALGLKHKGKQP